jgi:hypothetical protein
MGPAIAAAEGSGGSSDRWYLQPCAWTASFLSLIKKTRIAQLFSKARVVTNITPTVMKHIMRAHQTSLATNASHTYNIKERERMLVAH